MFSPRESLRVAIVDDHPAYRAGVARILNENGVDVVAEAPNGKSAIREVAETGTAGGVA